VAAGSPKLSSTGTEFIERCENEIAARRTVEVELAAYPRCGNTTLSSTNRIAPCSPRARSGWADCEFGATSGEPAAALKRICTPPWASVRSSVAHLPARALTRRPLFRPGQVFLGAFSVELPITARLLRLPEVRAGAQHRASMVRRAAPPNAPPCAPRRSQPRQCCPSSMAKTKLQFRLHGIGWRLQAHRELTTPPASARPLYRLVPPPPALLTPCRVTCHGPTFRRNTVDVTGASASRGSALLVEPPVAVQAGTRGAG